MRSDAHRGIVTDSVTFYTKFDNTKYACRDICVYNQELRLEDFDSKNNQREILMEGENIDLRTLVFSLRTIDKSADDKAKLLLAFIIGFIIFTFGVIFDFVKKREDSKKINRGLI